MEIRFAIAQDVPGIITLLRQVGRVHHEGRPDLFRSNAQKYSPSQILELLNNSNRPIFVAVEGEKVLGYGFCIMEYVENNSVLCDRTTLYIDDICVLEDCRGQHIGTKIYNEIIPVTEAEAYAAGRLMGRAEGILIGVSSGAALHAAMLLAKRPENAGKRIVVLLPDSGDRYLSTPMYQE